MRDGWCAELDEAECAQVQALDVAPADEEVCPPQPTDVVVPLSTRADARFVFVEACGAAFVDGHGMRLAECLIVAATGCMLADRAEKVLWPIPDPAVYAGSATPYAQGPLVGATFRIVVSEVVGGVVAAEEVACER